MNLRKVLQFTIGPVCAAGITFITLPVLAWMFSPEDIGRITLLQVAISFSFVFGGMALEQAYAREFYEHSDRAALLKITFIPGFLFTLIVVSMLLLVGVDVSELLFGVHDVISLVLVYVCVLANFIVAYSSLILRMNERALAHSLINISAKGLFLFLVLMVYFFGFSKNFHILIGLHSISVVVAMLTAVWLARKEWLAALYAPFLHQQLFGYVRFSLPLVFGGGAYWGLQAVDRISIRWWSDFEQLGIFSVAVSFAGVAVLFQSIFTTVWTPFIYRWNAEGLDVKRLSQITEHVLAAVVIIYSLVGAFSWLVSYLLPEKYSIISYIITACMGAPLLYMLSETTVVGLHLTRKTLFAMLAPLLALLVNMALNYVFVPNYGAPGAAAATNLAFLVFFFLRTEFSAAFWRPFPRRKLYFFAFLCSAVSSGQSIWYESLGVVSFFIWGFIFLFSLFSFRATILVAKEYLFSKLFSDSIKYS